MRDNTFSKKVFIKTVSDNLKNKYRKTIDDATQQELYQAVSEAVKDVIMDEWIATQRVMDKDDPKVVYYMSMEFLMGRADRKSTRLNSSHKVQSRMPSSA